MRTIAILGLLAAAGTASALGAAPRQPPAQPSFTTDASELVVLPVTVTDSKGQLVSDLSREQFTVFDNGRRQDVVLFSSEDRPVSVAIVIDDSGSMRGKLRHVLAATMAFARGSYPQDELFAIEFNDDVRDALGGLSIEAADEATLEAALRTLVPQGRTALYDALLAGLDRLDRTAHARKVIVLISDGGDNASRATLDEVLGHARKSNVTIYTIGLFEAGAPDTNPGVLKTLATATGGERFLPTSPGPLVQACHRIAREIRSGYMFGYVPPERDGRYHAVRVQVADASGRRLVVRTRPGYFAAKSGASR